MADETVWIDLGEVESAAKKILGLLDELKGPANRLEARVKQVQESVYGTDLVGKALQGGSSSVGGLAQHQEQVLAGIRVLIQNATAVGENLRTMAARHRANDGQQATALGGITDTGTLPTGPHLAGAGFVPTGTVTAGQQHVGLSSTGTATPTPEHIALNPLKPASFMPRYTDERYPETPVTPRYTDERYPETPVTPRQMESGTRQPASFMPRYTDERYPETPVTPQYTAERYPETPVTPQYTEQRHGRPMEAPASPPPLEGLGDLDPDNGYQAVDAPTLDYNTPPPPVFMGPGLWTPQGPAV
ncbi:hypothetical protein KNE206_66730 [Kitasatospora sp. NE20-6]|uniref:hypothetical protein n=1 Tax=Kitasatospora sp. NE20-6 TaxID=2859066 RepID=UPI0034DC2602